MERAIEKVVSIIIPCYNGEKTIDRCLDSILAQDYSAIEVIVVNDGSTDNSAEKIINYENKFKDAGMKLLLLNQENKGLAGAINTGLSVFSGEFLCWIDCDDYLLNTSIRKRVEFLTKNPEIAVVTSDAFYFKETDLHTPMKKASDGKNDLMNPYQFENHLRSKAIFCCGCHMVKTSAFLDAIPDRKIYPARRGQNWQMLLPVYYKYKQAFLDEPLYAYILYGNSMSAGDVTKEQYIKRYNEYKDIIVNTLDRINMSDKERQKYKNLYEGLYHRQLFYLGVSFHDYALLLKGMIKMICYGECKKEDFAWLMGLIKKQIRKKG